MVDVTLEKLEELYELLALRRLGDDAPPELFTRRLARETGGEVSGFSFLVGAAAELDATLINSPGDVDDDAVVGPPPASDDDEGFDWRPPIRFDEKFAWLKYRTLADIRLNAEGRRDGSLFGLDANAGVRIASYHRHAADARLADAIRADLTSLRTPFSAGDIADLGVGDATLVSAVGALDAAIELEWSDLLLSGASRLANLLDAGETLGIRLAAGATVRFDLGIRDEFRLVFARPDSKKIRVALLKKSVSSRALAAGADIEVRFADPDAVDRLLRDGLAGMTGVSERRLDTLIDRLGEIDRLDELTPRQQEVALILLDKLGLDRLTETAAALRERLVDLKRRVKDTIREVAESRVRIGVDYEYARIATDTALLEADLSVAALRRHHGDLVALKFTSVLGGKNGVELVRFLHEATTTRRSAYGFSLGVGKWQMSGAEQREQKFVTQRAQSGGLRVALLGRYAYTDEDMLIEKARRHWSAEFAAQTHGFSAGPTPVLAEFGCGLDLAFEYRERRTTRNEYGRLVDLAQLFGVMPTGDAAEQVDELQSSVGNGSTAARVSLTLDDTAVRGFCAFVATPGDAHLARALAAALPYRSGFAGRADLDTRIALYAPIWRYFLGRRSDWRSPQKVARLAYQHLKARGHGKLARRERDADRFGPASLAFVARRHPRLFERLDGMLAALRALNDGVAQRRPYTDLERISDGIQGFCDNVLYVRAIGALAHAYRKTDPVASDGVNAGLHVDFRSDGKPTSLTLATSRRA